MTEPNDRPDYRELMRSPYEPDSPPREEGDSDLPWKPAVFSAVLGALLVSGFVVYAAATGPEESEAATSTTSTTAAALEAEPSEELPPGFEAISDGAGAKVEGVQVTSKATYLAVASAVAGSEVPAETPPIEIAYWELDLDDGPRAMVRQYGELGILGNLTVEFEPLTALRGASLVAHPAFGTTDRSVSIDVPFTELPTEITDYRIDLGAGRTIIIDRLVIGDGWGNVDWSVEGEWPAKVDTQVIFVGTDDPSTEEVVDETRLSPSHLQTLSQGTGALPPGPLYAFEASQRLLRSGEPLVGDNVPTSIVVEFSVTIPESIGEPVVMEVPST